MSQREIVGNGWRIERRGRATLFQIERPETLNAISSGVMNGFERAIARVSEDADATGLIICSQGERTFISGGDLAEFSDLDTRDEAAGMSRRMGQILLDLEALPLPVVAAIDGDAYGGGAEISLACDIRLLQEGSSLVFSHRRFALMPGWGGATRLRERCGRSRALWLLLNGARVSGKDAVDLNLADEICSSAVARAESMVAGWESLSLTVLRGLKRALGAPERVEKLAAERELFLDCWMSAEHFEAVSRFFGAGDPD